MYGAGGYGNHSLVGGKLRLDYHLLAFYSLQESDIFRYVADATLSFPLNRGIALRSSFKYIHENRTDITVTEKGSLRITYGLQVSL